MKKSRLSIILVLVLCLSFSACTRKDTQFLIGISQCSNDEWRQKMNNEIRREAFFYDNIQVEVRLANDDSQQQISDIQYFIDKKIDILIVSPNEAAAITPIVEKAYEAGIPVITVDRNILSDKYTVYVGADNYEIGKAVGAYVASRLRGKGKIVEIQGLAGSTPAVERHQGFVDALAEYPGIRIVAGGDGGWLQDRAQQVTDTLLSRQDELDLVFAHNDRMAKGAYQAAYARGREKDMLFVGIDALPGKGYGVEQILNGELEASFIYPTGGDKILQIAMDVLRGKTVGRRMILSTALVEKINARVLQLQAEHSDMQDKKIELLNTQIDTYLAKYANQRLVLYGSLLILFILMTFFVVVYLAYRSKNRLSRELAKRNDEITGQYNLLQVQRDQLIELSKQLEEATHAKLVFFTNVSHDFRTPLTLIADPVDQLLNEKQLSADQKVLLRMVRKNVQILLRLVNQILDFRKYQNDKLETVFSIHNFQKCIDDWNHAFLPSARKRHIHFNFVATQTDFTMCFDVEKIERIYFNLLSNAFKFTPENGNITVCLATCEENGTKMAVLEITDSGQGIPEEKLPNIFDRFYQVNLQQGGSGIGLALVKAFIDLHAGSISVNSKVGTGTTFIVKLPFIQEKAVMGGEVIREENASLPLSEQPEERGSEEEILPDWDEPASENYDRTKETLLIIDDNPDIRGYIKTLFGKDFSVLEAADGKEGVRKAMKYVPDLIISDVMMPVMDGIECCAQLKKEMITCHIPVLLLTACTLDEQRIKGFDSGADSYISKPFNYKVLESRVHNLIEGRKRLKQFFTDKTSLSQESLCDMDKGFIRKFRELIEENMADSALNVEDLSKSMGISRVQLYRKIKSLTNYSPNELLRIARLKKAALLLVSSEMTVAEITYEVGFTSPSYFTKCYKDYFGESPSAFVKRTVQSN